MIVSCQGITKDEYIKWIEDNDHGLNKTKTISDFNYSIQYKPIEYILYKKNNDSLKIKDFDDLHYIDLTLAHKDYSEYLKINLKEKEDYYHRLKYFSFDIQNDLSLVDGKDSSKCVFSHFERTYGITPYIKIVLAFDKNKESTNDLFFVYHDHIFNNGIISIPIERKNINNIPKIKI